MLIGAAVGQPSAETVCAPMGSDLRGRLGPMFRGLDSGRGRSV